MEAVLEEMSIETVVRAIEENLFALFKSFGALPGTELHDDDHALWFITGLNSPMFNGVVRAKFGASGDLRDAIEETLAPFKAAGAPMFWWTGPATQPLDLDEQLQEHGLVPNLVNMAGMAADLTTLKAGASTPSEMTIRQVSSEASLKAWSDVFNLSFGTPQFDGEAWVTASTSLGLGPTLPWRLYLGESGGRVVAVSMLFLGAGVAGVYGVGTAPEARGRGIGAAMTLAPLLEAREMGYHVGILHASEMAEDMYRSLGFEEYCRLNRYVLL